MRGLAVVVIAVGCTSSPAGGVGPWEAPGELDEVSTFWLPTGAPRLGASGRASPRICVGLVWSFAGKELGRHCDDFGTEFPYAIVVENEARCGEVWAYQPNAVLTSIEGCIAPTADGEGAELDITASLSGPLFVGEIRLVSP